MLAEFGAEVIKIEAPNDGDSAAHNGASCTKARRSGGICSRATRSSICVNLKSAEGVDVVRRLAADADIVIENLRPGALERLGLGWDVLHGINPKPHDGAHLSGYGQSGPYRDRPGFGAIGEAMGGIRYTTGDVKARRHASA